MNRKKECLHAVSLYIAARLLQIIGFLFDALDKMFWWLWDKTTSIGDWCYWKQNLLMRNYYKKLKERIDNE